MQQDQNMERKINPIDADDAAIRASDRDQELGFLWGKIYIVVILINVLFALSSLVLNAIDPAEYASATPPIYKAYFIAITLIGSMSGFGLLFKARVGLYATLLVFSFFALLGLVVIVNMDTVGLLQGVVSFGIAFLGFRYFWRRRATFLQEPEEELPRAGARWSGFFTTSFGWVFVAAILYLNFGGIYFAFSRHGSKHGIISVFVPPYAWYRAVSPLWDTPKWQRDALDKVESLAYIVVHAQSGDPALRAEIAERIPKLRRLYQQQSPEFRASLDRSLTAFVELMDAIGHDIVDEIVRRGTLTIDEAAFVRRHQTLYDSATKYEGLRAALEATMLDAEYVRSMFSLTDTRDIPAEDRALMRDLANSTLKRWKDGAIQTKDRILR